MVQADSLLQQLYTMLVCCLQKSIGQQSSSIAVLISMSQSVCNTARSDVIRLVSVNDTIRLEIEAHLDCRNQGVSDQTHTSRATFTGITAQLRPLTPLFTCKGLPAFGALTAMAALSSSVAWLDTLMQI